MTRHSQRLALGLALGIGIGFLTACSGPEPAPSPSPSEEWTVPPEEHVLEDGFATPMPTELPAIAALLAGEIPVDIPAEWGQPEKSPRVDEGYVLQDFTWFLDGAAEGDIVTAAGMTPSQAEGLSGGVNFDEHVLGMQSVLAFSESGSPSLEWFEIDGVRAARIDATAPDGMRIVLWLYDLDAAFYELGFYGAPGAPADDARVAQFDAVARTFAVRG